MYLCNRGHVTGFKLCAEGAKALLNKAKNKQEETEMSKSMQDGSFRPEVQ